MFFCSNVFSFLREYKKTSERLWPKPVEKLIGEEITESTICLIVFLQRLYPRNFNILTELVCISIFALKACRI